MNEFQKIENLIPAFWEGKQNVFNRYVVLADNWLQDSDYRDPDTRELFDKKILNEKIRFVLPIKIGKVCIANVPVEIIERALEL